MIHANILLKRRRSLGEGPRVAEVVSGLYLSGATGLAAEAKDELVNMIQQTLPEETKGWERRSTLIDLAEALAGVGEGEAVIAVLAAARKITANFAKCHDMSEISHLYSAVGRYSDAKQVADTCQEAINQRWRLFAYATILRNYTMATNAVYPIGIHSMKTAS